MRYHSLFVCGILPLVCCRICSTGAPEMLCKPGEQDEDLALSSSIWAVAEEGVLRVVFLFCFSIFLHQIYVCVGCLHPAREVCVPHQCTLPLFIVVFVVLCLVLPCVVVLCC